MRALVCTLAVFITVLGVSESQNTPTSLRCDPFELVDWISGPATTAVFWEQLGTTRNFTLLCDQVDIWLANIVGCIDGIVNFAEFTFGATWRAQMREFYNVVAMMQFYCQNAELKQVCDVNAITGCATATILTWQEMFQADSDLLEELGNICESYDLLITTMTTCVETAVSECDAASQQSVMASYDMVFSYFQIAADYCGTACGNYILLVSSQFQNCDYINVDWNNLQFEEYCTYIQNTMNCIWTVYSVCPIATPEQSFYGVAGFLSYGEALGCNLHVDGTVLSEVPQSVRDVVMPTCANASIQCARTVAAVLGVTDSLGEYGGYDVSGVVRQMNEYYDRMASGLEGVCYIIDDVTWQTVKTCSNEIVGKCPVPQPESDEALLLINSQISELVEGICSDQCTQIQDAATNYLQCTAYLRTEEIDILRMSVSAVAALFSQGGGNTEVCQQAQGYLGCILDPIKQCSVIYDAYTQAIESFSSLEYVLGICNIFINFNNGDVVIDTTSNVALIYWSGGHEAVYSGPLMVLALTALLALR